MKSHKIFLVISFIAFLFAGCLPLSANAARADRILDVAQYFQGINGCAVFYRPAQNEYLLYNEKLCDAPSSPCSTFKIVSSLIGLHEGAINDEKLAWSGEKYWNEPWNKDMAFREAFQTSCVWYYRKVIDQIGKTRMQDALDRLKYGNADISDWEGRMNTNSRNPDLTGFWIESSLKISPRRQAEVLAAIFTGQSLFSPKHVAAVKDVMKAQESSAIKIYGKTGMGVRDGKCVDSWFVGFFEKSGETVYFAVRLDDPENQLTSSRKAREIAIAIILGEDLQK